MRISFHGAAQTVTGSQHLLEINGHRLLLDCGLFQGRRSETYERNLKFSYDPRKVDAVIFLMPISITPATCQTLSRMDMKVPSMPPRPPLIWRRL